MPTRCFGSIWPSGALETHRATSWCVLFQLAIQRSVCARIHSRVGFILRGWRLPFVRAAGGEPDAEDMRLAEIMSGYWARIAANRDPNRLGLPKWLPYDPATDSALDRKMKKSAALLSWQGRRRHSCLRSSVSGNAADENAATPR